MAFFELGHLLRNLGLWEANSKACPPATIMVFLGVLFNTEELTVAITDERLKEIKSLVSKWRTKHEANLTEVQLLAGKLNFVLSGRVFLSRILTFLREFEGKPGVKTIPDIVKQDVRWWDLFMRQFNGVTMFPELRWSKPDTVFSTDSCLTGCGGWHPNLGEYFHCTFPPEFIAQWKDLTINELECMAVVIAIKLWAKNAANLNLLLKCDNYSTVEVINRGHANKAFTQHCLHEIVWLTAKNNVLIKMCHCPEVNNRISDFLSRWHLNVKYEELFKKETMGRKVTAKTIRNEMFLFDNTW